MKKRGILVLLFIIIIASSLIFYSYTIPKPQPSSFDIIPLLFKVVLNQGDVINSPLDVTNFENETNFNFKTQDLNNILSLEISNLTISNNETKELNVSISGENSSYGVYVGYISVSNLIEEKTIPVIASIQTPKQLFAITLDVPANSKQIGKKDNIIADVQFYNIYDNQPHTVNVTYELFNLNGEKTILETGAVTIGSKSSFTKQFPLPENTTLGDYVFAVHMTYLDSVTTASYLFSVVDKNNFSFLDINSLAIIVSIFVIITFFLVVYVLYERNLLLSRLKKQHGLQIKNSYAEILKEQKKCLTKAKSEKQKEKILEEFRDAKEKIIHELKKQQHYQIRKLNRLDDKTIKNKDELLRQWNKESYSKAIRAAQISDNLKDKLSVLQTAYDEGFIKKRSYDDGVSNIKSANKKFRRNIYK
jgi:hypothetical protein